jgi:hypothetical protein
VDILRQEDEKIRPQIWFVLEKFRNLGRDLSLYNSDLINENSMAAAKKINEPHQLRLAYDDNWIRFPETACMFPDHSVA